MSERPLKPEKLAEMLQRKEVELIASKGDAATVPLQKNRIGALQGRFKAVASKVELGDAFRHAFIEDIWKLKSFNDLNEAQGETLFSWLEDEKMAVQEMSSYAEALELDFPNHAPTEEDFENEDDGEDVPLPSNPLSHEEIASILYRRFEAKDEHKNPKGLTYLKEKAIVRRLNEAFGVFGWQTEYTIVGSAVTCTISAYIDGNWLKRTNGSGIQSKDEPQNIKQSMEDIVKTAYTDAFKRAARSWGIGWYLLG